MRTKKTRNKKPMRKTTDNQTELKEGGGLQNMAQLLSNGYTIAAYVMSTKTRNEIDAWIAANPNRNPPFSAAPTEIDETVESIMVRLDEPNIDTADNEEVLAAMKNLAPLMPKMDPAKSDTAAGDTYDQ